jgi:hypothetical protein
VNNDLVRWRHGSYKDQLSIGGCIQKFPDWVDNEINNNKHSSRSNTKGYGCKTHKNDSQNSDTTAPSGRELYHLQFSIQAASPETYGYTLVKLVASRCSLRFLENLFNGLRFL